MEMMKNFHEIAAQSLERDRSSISQVAVIVDEKASCFCPEDDARAVLYRLRKTLSLMGTPFDCYLCEDFPAIKDRYQAFLVLAPHMSEDLKQVLAQIKEEVSPKAALVITPENAEISTEELREFLKTCGVHLFCSKDAVVYANASYLFLHTASDGPAEFHLPEGMCLRQIYGDPVNLASTNLPKYEGYLFEIVNS
jgi:hypothetical protein